jgi:hypothetical protein
VSIAADAVSPTTADFALDLAGFLTGITLALALGWSTTDLIWGLWLSSLVIGYSTILLGIARAPAGGSVPAAIAGKVFLVAFFTVHFGMFHFVHSVFLNVFFPVAPRAGMQFGPGLPGYGHVFASYWPWLLAAAIAERRALLAPFAPGTARREFNPGQPYVNVVRMHLLIFFFAGAAALGLDGFLVFAVVYVLYFWPWRRAPRWFGGRAAPAT